MRALVIIALLTLTGCGPQPGPSPKESSLTFDFEAADGVRLRALPGDPLTLEQFETVYHRAYLETEACVGTLAPGPGFVVVDTLSGGRAGYTFWNEAVVLIAQPWQLDDRVVRHETVHYLLNQLGVDHEANRCHASPLFQACAGYEVGGCL